MKNKMLQKLLMRSVLLFLPRLLWGQNINVSLGLFSVLDPRDAIERFARHFGTELLKIENL